MARKSARVGKSKWLCGTCASQCNNNAVFCEGCNTWQHATCEGLDKSQLGVLNKLAEDYLCSSCTYVRGKYDYTSALRRLGKASMAGTLETAVKMELILMRDQPATMSANVKDVVLGNRFPDRVALEILRKFGGVTTATPVVVPGDGNCLFHAISLAVSGSISLATELMVRSCIEMVANRKEQVDKNKPTNIHLISPDYDEAIHACAVDGSFSSAWTISAAATVLNRKIISVYPPVNGLMDRVVPILQTTFPPLNKNPGNTQIAIMWSSSSPPSSGTWTPNHFVPLLKDTMPVQDNLCSPTRKTYAEVTQEHPRQTSTPNKQIPRNVEQRDKDVEWCACDTSRCDSDPTLDEIPNPLPVSPEVEIRPPLVPDCSQPLWSPDISVVDDEPVENIEHTSLSTSNTMSEESADHDQSRELLSGRFLDIEQLCEVLQNSPATSHSIPKGIKENTYMVIKNDDNLDRRSRGKRSNFEDDCGVWQTKSSSTKTTLFYHNGQKLTAVQIKNNQYCTRQHGKWTPVQPQPACYYYMYGWLCAMVGKVKF